MNTSQYAFADRAQEQRRLATQAELLDPLTERVFREAGLGTGMRVLDLGSGAGDVAILAARLVGREGEVIGVERDPEAVAWAADRVAQVGLSNVRWRQACRSGHCRQLFRADCCARVPDDQAHYRGKSAAARRGQNHRGQDYRCRRHDHGHSVETAVL
jgi:SAM-dependent methyltransferase